jgi:hypothetical protein
MSALLAICFKLALGLGVFFDYEDDGDVLRNG